MFISSMKTLILYYYPLKNNLFLQWILNISKINLMLQQVNTNEKNLNQKFSQIQILDKSFFQFNSNRQFSKDVKKLSFYKVTIFQHIYHTNPIRYQPL